MSFEFSGAVVYTGFRPGKARWEAFPLTGGAKPERVENPVIRFIRSSIE
ncbi:MAG: hypothetical protein ABI119_07050 [Gemmatimonadaceae bacterium]